MRAARIIADDPNPDSASALKETLKLRSQPAVVINEVSDTTALAKLRVTQAKFQEKKRLYDLSREARLLKEQAPGFIKIKVLRPRAQMVGEEKRILDAYVDFIVEVPGGAKGRALKSAIASKQRALVLPTIEPEFLRLFLHQIGGRATSPHIGKEILNERGVDEYGIEEGLAYDVNAFVMQDLVAARAAAIVLMVDARPGKMLPEQIQYVNECRGKESACYANIS